MSMKKLLAAAAALTLAACSSTSSKEQPKPVVANNDKLAEIYGFEVRQKTLWFRVKSTGCTRKEDFKLELTPANDGRMQASLYRLKADYCRAMPRIIGIDMSHQALLQQELDIVVQNPVKDAATLMGRPKK